MIKLDKTFYLLVHETQKHQPHFPEMFNKVGKELGKKLLERGQKDNESKLGVLFF